MSSGHESAYAFGSGPALSWAPCDYCGEMAREDGNGRSGVWEFINYYCSSCDTLTVYTDLAEPVPKTP